MSGTVDQVQVETILAFADDDAFFGERDAGIGGVSEVGHEDAFPQGRPLRILHVLHVEDDFGESFIEDARLNLERNLGALEPIFEVAKCCERSRGDVQAVGQRQEPGGDDKN